MQGVVRDLGGTGVFVLGDFHIQNYGVVGGAPVGVSEEIPQGVGNQRPRALVKRDGLQGMGVGADDHVHTVLFQQ